MKTMKKNWNWIVILAILFTGYISISDSAEKVEAQNSCPEIAPYLCNNGSCTNDSSLCDQSWGGGLSTNNTAPPEKNPATTGSVTGGATCSGDIRYDSSAAAECARIAEAQGKALGYNISCSTSPRPEAEFNQFGDIIGEHTTFYGSCSINGELGFSPETLAGYTGSGTGYIRPGTNNPIFGAGFKINPMWYTVPSILQQGTGVPGSASMIGTFGTPGSNSFINSIATVNNSGSNGFTPINLIRATAGSNTPGRITSQHVSSLLASVNNLVSTAKRLYGVSVTTPSGLVGVGSGIFSTGNTGGGSTITSGTTGIGNTGVVNTNFDSVVKGSGETLSNARYLRIETSERGWLSWREIEIYDQNGDKINPASIHATAGITYGILSSNASPDKAFDGDPETAWNAGETNGNCITAVYGCVQTLRTGYIEIDLGSVKDVSKIRVMQSGGTWSESSKLYVSSNRSKFTQLTEFTSPMRDREWLEYPAPAQSEAPTITFTADGQSTLNITMSLAEAQSTGRNVKFDWDVQNADQLLWDEVVTNTSFRICPSSGQKINPFTNGYNSALGITEDQPAFSASSRQVQLFGGCAAGTHTITLVARQRYTGVETQKTVIVNVTIPYP